MTSGKAQPRTLVALLTIATAAGVSASAAQGASIAAGMLPLQVEVHVSYPPADCPAGTSRLLECFVRTGDAVVPGLGRVVESYAYLLENGPAGCTAPPGADAVRHPPTTARLAVPGKGEIEVSTSGTGCLTRSGTLRATEPFAITGGSGLYAGASGGGTLTSMSFGPPGWIGIDTWTGSLVVPGLQFDLTEPTINGAGNKTVRVARRAKRARVTYTVTAQDEVDGVVPVTCSPRSGSPFSVGRTRVTCSARDTSGNTSAATFTVTVKRRG